MSSKELNLNVNGKQIAIRPMTEIKIKDIVELAKLDRKSEYYEVTQASLMLKAALVDASDWEHFENMTIAEFGEIMSDWSHLHNSEIDG